MLRVGPVGDSDLYRIRRSTDETDEDASTSWLESTKWILPGSELRIELIFSSSWSRGCLLCLVGEEGRNPKSVSSDSCSSTYDSSCLFTPRLSRLGWVVSR